MNLVGIVVTMLIGSAGNNVVANVMGIVCLISFVPCLYVGMKPNEE